MKIPTRRNAPAIRRLPRGFALVVTLTLMVLLSILALGMLSLSTVSLRSGSVTSADEIARANARLGLLTALGKLQTQLGPDQRISARAVSFAADPGYGVTVSDNTPGAWWVGVAHGKPAALDPVVPSPRPLPDGKKVDWLVSGVTGSALGNAALTNPVPMYSANSLDLAKYTSGEEIKAGRVAIKKDSASPPTGHYAWFVDDEGMKAQLAPSNSKALNSDNAGRGMLAAGADLGELEGMTQLAAADPVLLAKLNSVRDLPFLGSPKTIAAAKHFGYTTRSLGVLSDTRLGGLRKDLTIAFENDTVFNNVFPQGDQEKYLVLDPDKLSDASDLRNAGYIHWNIFKDYYNLKKGIQTQGSIEFLDHTSFDKEGLYAENPSGNFRTGRLGPHQINETSGDQVGHPYGEYKVMRDGVPISGAPGGYTTDSYKHSPVSPVLSFLQMSGWVTEEEGMFDDPDVKVDPPKIKMYYLKTHTQLWTGHYNPYNIGLRVKAENGSAHHELSADCF